MFPVNPHHPMPQQAFQALAAPARAEAVERPETFFNCPEEIEMAREAFRILCSYGYHEDNADVIDRHLFVILHHSVRGNVSLLNREKLDSPYIHPQNRDALLRAAYDVALKNNRPRTARFFLEIDPHLLQKPFTQFDKTKEIDTLMISSRTSPDKTIAAGLISTIVGLFALSLSPQMSESNLSKALGGTSIILSALLFVSAALTPSAVDNTLENIALRALKSNNFDVAQKAASKARTNAGSDRIWFIIRQHRLHT